jgi:hypothetical protein
MAVTNNLNSYFNFYSLDFSRAQDFIQEIAQNQDELGVELQAALTGKEMRSKVEEHKNMEKVMARALNICMDDKEEETPGYRMFQEQLSNVQKARAAAQEVLSDWGGADPFAVQGIVHKILGIPENIESTFSDELRQRYLTLMKNSGFLITEYTSVNRQDEKPIDYRTHVLASNFLQEHPKKRTLTIGCGELAKTYFGSCHFRRAKDHIEDSFTIDILAQQRPDLIVDMHDLDFWSAVPNERFEKIFDHTYGPFLFENPHAEETIAHIFRTLKPGGYLEMDHDFDFRGKNYKQLLQKAGFTVDENEPKKAIKA